MKTPDLITVISGEETLLINEATATIEKSLKNKGFSEKTIFDQDNQETWEKFRHLMHSRSLFSDKVYFICRLTNSKLSQHAQTSLETFANHPPADKALIVILGKLTPQQQNAPWLAALKKAGRFMPIWPITLKQFPTWLKERLHKAGYSIDKDAFQLLCDHTEGNLLAANQCIEKLQLLDIKGALNQTHIYDVISEASQYSVFDLVNALWQKNTLKTEMILETLRTEGMEPAIILWAIARECRKHQQSKLIPLLFKCDQTIKGADSTSPWQSLKKLCFSITGNSIP